MSDLSAHHSVVLYTYRTHTDSVLTSIPSGAISICQERYGLPVTQSDLLKKQATCCPPLANFAQLSMFRFDGLKIQIKLYYRQQTKLYLMARETYVSVFVGDLFCKDEKKPALAGLF